MPRTEVIHAGDAAPTWRHRLRDTVAAVRSVWHGPFGAGDRELVRLLGTGRTAAGIAVTAEQALRVPAFRRALAALAGDASTLPLPLYRPVPGGGRARVTDHPLHGVLNEAANPELTAAECRSTLIVNTLLHGNGYAEIERDQVGRVKHLWPLRSHQVTPFRDERHQLRYRVTGAEGPDVVLPPTDVVHLRGLTSDGLTGRGLVDDGREALALLIAAERFASAFFRNGGAVRSALSHPKQLGPDGQKNLRESLASLVGGADQAFQFLVLEEDMKVHQIGVAPEAAELGALRAFQAREVSRLTGVPLSRLSEPADVNRATAREESLVYYTGVLRPWLVQIEQQLTFRCLSTTERRSGYYVEHLADAVLRSDPSLRSDIYRAALAAGWMSVNEVRQLENLPAVAGADTPRVPLNTSPIAQEPAA